MIHPALRKLLGLRLRASLRRLVRGLKTLRGAAFSVIGAATLVLGLGPQVMLLFVNPAREAPDTLQAVLPLVLLGYCLLSILSSASRGGIHFTPAEIDLLFSAPFTRRQMLVYKLACSLPGVLFLTVLLPVFLLRYKIAWIAILAGGFLTLVGIQLLTTAVVLFGQTIAQRAYTRLRKAALIVLIIAVGLGLGTLASSSSPQESLALVRQFSDSTAGAWILAPFTVFSRTITAERIFPDLVGWGLLAAMIDLGLLGVVLRLDVNYLEASVAASQKFYERLQRARQGRIGGASSATAAWRVPRLPWLGGAGPIAHRQLITTMRSLRVVALPVVVAAMMIMPMLISRSTTEAVSMLLFPLVFVSVFFSRMLPFDFRGDLDHFDWLKSVPLHPVALAAGQLVVPVLLMTLLHGLAFATIGLLSPGNGDKLIVLALFTVPFNAIVFGLDNFVFLLFPVRLAPTTPGDFQHTGRAMVEMFLKIVGMGICCGVAAGLGGLIYWLTGGMWIAFLITTWLALAVLAASLVPCVAWAYGCFDVSTDTPP